MKVAVTGKGGVGKTTVTAALARTVARLSVPVVAVDADPNPNLGVALGLGLEANDQVAAVANSLLRRRSERHHAGDADVAAHEPDAEELLDLLGHRAPDGVRLLQTGRIERPSDGCLCCGSHRSTRRMFDELSADDRLVIADLEAGVTDLCWTNPKPADTVLIVSTSDRSSVEVASRSIQVARDLGVGRILVVANRLRGPERPLRAGEARPGTIGRLADLLQVAEVVEIPEDPSIGAAEQRELSPLDLDAGSPAMQAIQALALHLLDRPRAPIDR